MNKKGTIDIPVNIVAGVILALIIVSALVVIGERFFKAAVPEIPKENFNEFKEKIDNVIKTGKAEDIKLIILDYNIVFGLGKNENSLTVPVPIKRGADVYGAYLIKSIKKPAQCGSDACICKCKLESGKPFSNLENAECKEELECINMPDVEKVSQMDSVVFFYDYRGKFQVIENQNAFLVVSQLRGNRDVKRINLRI